MIGCEPLILTLICHEFLHFFLLIAFFFKWQPSTDHSGSSENMKGQRFRSGNYTSSEPAPTKLVAEIGKNGRNMTVSNQGSRLEHGSSSDNLCASTSGNQPWFWFPSPDRNCWAPDFLGRSAGMKDELPWKIKASVLYSARAHPGALRSLAVHDDECTIFTGGVGPGFKGSIQKWELPNMNCSSGYYGHEEVSLSYFLHLALFLFYSATTIGWLSFLDNYIHPVLRSEEHSMHCWCFEWFGDIMSR